MREGRRFEGRCHCGEVVFRVRASRLEALDCNCSICTKKGFLHLIVSSDAFEIVSGAGALTTYTFNTGVAKHTFCRTCGVHPFYVPRSHPDGVDVNVRCLERDLDGDGGDPRGLFTIAPFDGADWEANVDTIR